MSASFDPRPLILSPVHRCRSALPSKPVAPKIVTRMAGTFECRAFERAHPTLQLVQPIEGCHFVCFRQGGVVENSITEVFDCSSHSKYCLTDVNDFCGAISDCVDTEQPQTVRIKQELK